MLRDTIIAAIAVFTFTPSGAAEQDKAVTADSRYQAPGVDRWIETRLTRVYSLNEILNPLSITADAENGKVPFTGKVDNKVEKNLDGRIVSGLADVTAVDERHEIVNEGTGERKNYQLFRLISNATVATRIETRLLGMARLLGWISTSIPGKVLRSRPGRQALRGSGAAPSASLIGKTAFAK